MTLPPLTRQVLARIAARTTVNGVVMADDIAAALAVVDDPARVKRILLGLAWTGVLTDWGDRARVDHATAVAAEIARRQRKSGDQAVPLPITDAASAALYGRELPTDRRFRNVARCRANRVLERLMQEGRVERVELGKRGGPPSRFRVAAA